MKRITAIIAVGLIAAAQAFAQSMDEIRQIAASQGSTQTLFADTRLFSADELKDLTFYSPADICVKRGRWKNISTTADARFRPFAPWFPNLLLSGHQGSCLSFAFEGDMFGIMDVGCPSAGQLEVFVDGQMVRLNDTANKTYSMLEATSLTGTHFMNRFNSQCNKRYCGQYELIKVERGRHEITLRLSDQKTDKRAILGEDNLADFNARPQMYDSLAVIIGRIIVRGKAVEAHPVKGLPKLAQQTKWENKMSKYADADKVQAAWKDVNLVVGSSSIDMWKSLETDFPGKQVINRGISGTKAIDLYNYRQQLIAPYDAKRIIVYEGDNEIGYKWEIPEMVEQMKRLFFEIRRMKPDAEIYWVSIKPSPVRIKYLPKIQEVNRIIKEFVTSQPNAGYIDIHTPMLDKDGNVREELFRKDRLHPTPEAYAIWRDEFAKVIR